MSGQTDSKNPNAAAPPAGTPTQPPANGDEEEAHLVPGAGPIADPEPGAGPDAHLVPG